MKRRITIIFICLHIAILSVAQTAVSVNKDTANAGAEFLKNWQKNLFDRGFAMESDSLHLTDEANVAGGNPIIKANGSEKSFLAYHESLQN